MTTAASDAFLNERRAFLSTLEDVGPDAPTLIDGWTAADMAAHIAGGELAAGVPVFLARLLVRRGIDVTFLQRAGLKQQDRLAARGWSWALDRLRRDPPALVHRSPVAPVSLLEVWVHHEDVRRANGRGPDPARNYPELQDCLAVLKRYQRKTLGSRSVSLEGPVGEAVLWMAGRSRVARVAVDADVAGIAEQLRL